MPRPISAAGGGVKLAVRLTPKASRNKVEGLAADADGGVALKVSVTAVPENGKANAALIQLLAKSWKLPKSSLEIIQGATDRRKLLFIAGDSAQLLEQIGRLLPR